MAKEKRHLLWYFVLLETWKSDQCARRKSRSVDLDGHDWMRHLDDEKYLSQLSIPGTHNSAAHSEIAWYCRIGCKCQDRLISQQLDGGVRFLDLRLRRHETHAFKCDFVLNFLNIQ